ncbi:MAG: TonB-dependent receptor [Bacteroidetes bacterium]|nr:TonB-dependent receptor [Bacteroidota bacterium]MBX7129099.1 TonB-dependent receptor [Flavobacteriales bacterium]MCC6653860.1 TonB-dependent receptor [Flavobacteriales bacterium]HMU13412.1 TonB-dependent receptor [Flavobacteriales bacterium]HMW97007.1 TonB-dependent receptor [Flavobacteriales bacterium]
MTTNIEHQRVPLSPNQKSRRINQDMDLYGTFAEIGAGQETVRHFFRAGGASMTIAKAMSAYDKDFSNAIYGPEPGNRFVCESRLKNMLRHEYGLMLERLSRKDHPTRKFFTFANTVATSTFERPHGGHGWLGVRFQTAPDRPTSDVIVHVRLHDPDISLQQENIGIMGVNLIHACFFHHKDPQEIMTALYDNVSRHVVEIDMIQMNGPDFSQVDNRLLSLQLVKRGYTDAVIFGPDGQNLQASEVLYKKNILAIRGSFRPVTKVNIDMIMNGYNMFIKENRVDRQKLQVLFEITLNNLQADTGDVDEKDFIDRADILCSLGQTVLISNYQEYYKLVEYFSRFTKARLGLIMGVNNLIEVFEEKYYRNLNGGMLEAFGILFTRDLKVYVYPSKPTADVETMTLENMPVHPRLRPLYDYLVSNKRMVDIENYDPSVLPIFSQAALRMIRDGEPGWESMVPPYVDNMIKDNRLFGYVPPEVEAPGKAQKAKA